MNNQRPYCLTIGGFDPTAGAGVIADCKTFEMLQVYGMGIISSNTLQTDDCFIDVDWVPVETMIRQVETLLKRYCFKALKIGLVRDFDMLYQLISIAKGLNSDLKIVWDPILKSSSGYCFHSKDSMQLRFLEMNCQVITPNWNEFEALWGADHTILKEQNASAAILLKGGHRQEKTGSDILFANGQFTEIQGESFAGKSKHGTGCVLSAAIAAYLAQGYTVLESCKLAKSYVEDFIQSNEQNLGYHYANK